MTQLPPPRDLPPYLHARMRAELERAVTEPARRRRSAPLVATAGLTAGALVAVAVWLVPERPQPVVAGEPASQVLAGLAPAEVAAIEDGCGLSSSAASPGTADAAMTLELRNLVDDDAGRVALLYADIGAVTCEVGPPGYSAGGLNSLGANGPVTIDAHDMREPWRAPDGTFVDPPATYAIAGRVTDARVARVTATATKAGMTVTATLSGGTYLARFIYEPPWQTSNERVPVVIHAYDANGVLLATASE